MSLPAFNKIEPKNIDVNKEEVRQQINVYLHRETSSDALTPYIGLEKVRRVLAYYHIHLPQINFLEGDHGVETFEVYQFGMISGLNDKGEVVTRDPLPYHIFFEYAITDEGLYKIFCEIVDDNDLDELLDDANDDIDDESPEEDREDQLDEEEEPKPKRVRKPLTPEQKAEKAKRARFKRWQNRPVKGLFAKALKKAARDKADGISFHPVWDDAQAKKAEKEAAKKTRGPATVPSANPPKVGLLASLRQKLKG